MVAGNRGASGPTNQHFVPRCYLGEFTDPQTPAGQEPYAWVFDKNKRRGRRRAPKNIFTETNLYTFEFSGEKDFTIEESLSTVESNYASVYRARIRGKKPLSDEDHAHLCAFVAAQLHRTLRAKRHQEDSLQRLIDLGEQMARAHGITDSPQLNEWRAYKKDAHKLLLMDSIPRIAAILMQMSVAFLCSRNPAKHWFITSDHPCVIFNPDLQWQRMYGPGFGQQNVQLSLALSPEITAYSPGPTFMGIRSSAAQ